MLSNNKNQMSVNSLSEDILQNLGLLMVFQKIDELKNLQKELLDKEARHLEDLHLGLTVDEAASYLKKGRQQVLAMIDEGILEWRIFGTIDGISVRGKKLISIKSLLEYKKALWNKDFDGDGFFTNIQGIHQRAKVTLAEAEKLGILTKNKN